jgi:hypothetical protein
MDRPTGRRLCDASVARTVDKQALMNVLLAIDHSTCSEAAVNAVLNQFQPEKTIVRLLHVVEWPRG